MAQAGSCPVCGRDFTPARRGRPRIFCSDPCKLVNFGRTHALGWRLIRELGVEDVSPLEMLREHGVTSA